MYMGVIRRCNVFHFDLPKVYTFRADMADPFAPARNSRSTFMMQRTLV